MLINYPFGSMAWSNWNVKILREKKKEQQQSRLSEFFVKFRKKKQAYLNNKSKIQTASVSMKGNSAWSGTFKYFYELGSLGLPQ